MTGVMVKIESLAHEGVITMRLDDNLDNAFILRVCVFGCVARLAVVAHIGNYQSLKYLGRKS